MQNDFIEFSKIYPPDTVAECQREAEAWHDEEMRAEEIERQEREGRERRRQESAKRLGDAQRTWAWLDENGVDDSAWKRILDAWLEKRERARREQQLSLYSETATMTVPPFPSLPTPAPEPDLIQNSGTFVGKFECPDYIVEGIFQRGYFYSVTAQTGVGKTAVLMRVSAHVAVGRNLGPLEVAKGQVLYFAGENPTDIRMRWLGACQETGIDPNSVDVHFIEGALPLSQVAERITAEVVRKGLAPTFVVVDTSAAYDESDDENSNSQAGQHARRLRSLTNLPGKPCVVALCHPTKRAADDDLIPRGGGAYLAEVDGNVALRKCDNLITLGALGKFRGPEFPPVSFELHTVMHPRLKDARGRNIPTVVAAPVSEASILQIEAGARRNENALLRAIEANPGASLREIANKLGWLDRSGKPNAMKVSRMAATLEKEKLVRKHRGTWEVTTAGQKELNRIDMGAGRNSTYPLTGSVTPPVTPGSSPPPLPPQ